MKKVLGALLFMVFLPIAFQQVAIIMHFKRTLTTIEQKYCINKSKPALQCHGKCYLKKQLAHTADAHTTWYLLYKNIDMAFSANFLLIVKNLPTAGPLKTAAHKSNTYKEPYIEIVVQPPIA